MDKYFRYLEKLRNSGKTNMYGASPYLQREFPELRYDLKQAKEILLEKEIDILVDLKDGSYEAAAWGCDLTYDYVKINGDYRT